MARIGCVLALAFLLLLQLQAGSTNSLTTSSVQGPSREFSSHRIVKPRVYHARSKRQISTTKENDAEHTEFLSVGLELNGSNHILDLRLNKDLIPVGYKERYQHKGNFKASVPTKVELCHYQGSIRDIPGSWAAVSTCNGLKGVIYDGETLHHIQPEEESLHSSHYLYKHTDLIVNNTCGYKGTHHNILDEFRTKETGRISRHKRAAESIRGPYNANRQSRYVELVLVIDKNEYTSLGENLTRVHQHCKDIANIINALYTPLNIFVALVGVEVWTENDKIHLLSNGDTTLNNFLSYRREKLVKEIPNDNAQLLTKMQFDEGVVGKALKGPICTNEFSGGVSVDHSNVVGLVAATVAHEMGHNFGMEHDSAECICPEDRCIMAPSSGSSGPTHWSSCSLEYLALAFEHGMDYCLRNKPQRLFDSPICGNGFVEPGEQCDCGLVENCDNPCCDATTCMLHSNASCATGECCDLQTCRPKKAGTECRSADQECDLPEYCTGESEYCPADVFKIDGEVCSMGKAFCYQGSCRTHNDQCKLLWGPTGTSSDDLCYEMNNKGSKNGNCGFNRTINDFIKCDDDHVRCGMLHCKHLNERLEFGMESVATLSHSFINSQGKIIACRSAIVDLGLNQVDPGLAPDGAKCGPGKMCVNQKCMPVAELRMLTLPHNVCPNNCSGNGVCNSLGHCHCIRGYQPPDCTEPGVGGSQDSGPAADPNARSEYIMSLYIIFLGIVPTVSLIAFGVWYARNTDTGMKHWKKASGPMSTLSRSFGFDHHHHQHHPPNNRHYMNNGGASSLPGIKTIDPLPRVDVVDSSGIISQQDPACASLLPKNDPDERFNNNFFGQFKGFSISPLRNNLATTSSANNVEATRPAPAPPATWDSGPTTVPIKTNLRPIQRNSTLGRSIIQTSEEESEEKPVNPPKLPPPNIGSTARLLISSPILAATTCTSMELIGQKVPIRPAPEIPNRSVPEKPLRPASTTLDIRTDSIMDKRRSSGEKHSPSSNNTLTRIASMLYSSSGVGKSSNDNNSSRYHTHSLPRNHHKANKVMDKEILRSLKISNPIPQSEIDIPVAAIPVKAEPEEERKRHIPMRAQSMRDSKVTPRSGIQSFGSMRSPSTERPVSIMARVRPTSPPPVPPVKSPTDLNSPSKITQIHQPPVTETSTNEDETYDDCVHLVADSNLGKIMEESPSNDNIYAVIEECGPGKKVNKTPSTAANQVSDYKVPQNTESENETQGLLSEIVSELSNRNVDSIYSTRALSPEHCTYTNEKAVMQSKLPDNLYSNEIFEAEESSKSSISEHPEVDNVPLNCKISETQVKELGKPIFSKPKTPEKQTVFNANKSGLSRIKNPPGLTKPSSQIQLTRNVVDSSSSRKSTSQQNSDSSLKSAKTELTTIKDSKINSPDLVSSCSTNQTSKSPDVVGKPKATATSISTISKTSALPKQNKVITIPQKPALAKTPSFSDKNKMTNANSSNQSKVTTPTRLEPKTSVLKPNNVKTNVASLQQKFEQSEKSTTGLTKKKPNTANGVNFTKK